MDIIKCDYCKESKLVWLLSEYVYKKKKKKGKVVYFCSYNCMRKAEQENPNGFCDRRD